MITRLLVRAWALVALVIASAPLVVLAVHGGSSLRGIGRQLLHLLGTVFPHQLGYSLIVSLGSAMVALAFALGALSAASFDFPGRAWLVRLAVLPLLLPTWWLAAIFGARLGLDGVFGTIFAEGLARSPLVVLLGGASLLAHAKVHGDLLRVLGRSSFTAALSVLLPLSRGAIAVALALVAIAAFGDATTPKVNGVPTLVVGLVDHWLAQADDGVVAIAVVVALLVALAPAIGVALALARRARDLGAGLGARGARLPLVGSARLLPWALGAPQLVFGVIVPGWSLGQWTVERIGRVQLASLGEDLLHSVLLAAGSTLFAFILALPLVGSASGDGARARRTAVIVGGLVVPVVLPPILLGLAFLWMAPETGEGALGAIAAVVNATPIPLAASFAVRWAGLFFGTLIVVLEGSARARVDVLRLVGRSGPMDVLRFVGPFLAPALAGVSGFVFLQVLGDVEQTVLLQPFGFETLPSRIFRYVSTQRLEDAAPWVTCLALTGLYPLVTLARRAGLIEREET